MSEGQAKLPNGEITSNVYDAFDKGYAQAKIDLAEQAVEQEPVAWLITHHENQPVLTFNSSDWASERFVKTPLYAHPPKRQPLSYEEIEAINKSISKHQTFEIGKLIFTREIEK